MINSDKLPISKEDIINLLKKRTGNIHVGLPRDVDFFIQDGTLSVNVHKPTLSMLTNEAAFEGWISVLKAWLPDKIINVVLDYISPPDLPKAYLADSVRCHYNRFLYRINNYSRLFPDWFSVHQSKISEVSEFMKWLAQEHCMLNHSLEERGPVVDSKRMEKNIESWFRFGDGEKRLCERWQLDNTKIFNQLPVGVFHEEILAKNAVFPSGTGAIDLWGVAEDGMTLNIIELKCGYNIDLGVIGEILFYTAIMYDTCVDTDNFLIFGRYKNSKDTSDMIISHNDGTKFKHLYSHVLAEFYHSLFSDEVMQLLKAGLLRLDIKFDREIYNYKNKTFGGTQYSV